MSSRNGVIVMALRYVAIGDSVAVGYRALPGEEYVARIHRSLLRTNAEWSFVKIAASGATSPSLPAFARRAIALRPHLVTVNIGGNDLRHALPYPQRTIDWSAKNVERALGSIRGHTSASVYLAGIYNPVSTHSPFYDNAEEAVEKFNLRLASVAASTGCVFVPIAGVVGSQHRGTIAPDGLHPSNKGHALIAAAFLGAGISRVNARA